MKSLKASLSIGVLALTCAIVVVEHRSALVRVRTGCAITPWVHPVPHDSIRDSDYVEIGVLPGYSSYQRFRVRMWGDGRIYRSNLDCPIPQEAIFTSVDPVQAKQLIKAAQIAFCSMCSTYGPPGDVVVVDAGASRITVSTASLTKTVKDAAGEPDPAYGHIYATLKKISGVDPFVDRSKFSKERKAVCLKAQQAERTPPGWFPTLP